MPMPGVKPSIPASGWPQTYTLDCVATVISYFYILPNIKSMDLFIYEKHARDETFFTRKINMKFTDVV
jgi:hypothetical protein